MASYHHTLGATLGQYVFDRYVVFNLASIVDWCVITPRNQQKFDIDNACKNPHNSDMTMQ